MSPSPVGWRVLAAGTAVYLAVVVGLVGFSVVTAAAAPPPCLPGTGAGGPLLSELTLSSRLTPASSPTSASPPVSGSPASRSA